VDPRLIGMHWTVGHQACRCWLADVGIDVRSHYDFVVCRKFTKESIECVKESGIDVVGTSFGTWVVDRCECEGKVRTSLLAANLFS